MVALPNSYIFQDEGHLKRSPRKLPSAVTRKGMFYLLMFMGVQKLKFTGGM